MNTSWHSINDLIEFITITPRTTWNSKVDVMHALKYLSWTLNVNINLFTICEKKNSLHKNKFVLQYHFQNTLVKVLRQQKDFPSIDIVTFEKKYYLLTTPNIFPTLINLPALPCITFNNINITPDHVMSILKKCSKIDFSFTIKIFTSYSFIKHNSKQLCTNMIGQYTNANKPNPETLFIFITPCLERSRFYMHQLKHVNHAPFYKTYPYIISPINEGTKVNFKTTSLPKTTNQKLCICQHEETQEMPLPKKFNNLGIPYINI